MTTDQPTRYRLDRDGDLWHTTDDDRWTTLAANFHRLTLEDVEAECGPTVELVPATDLVELRAQLAHWQPYAEDMHTKRNQLRAEVDAQRGRAVRAEQERDDWQAQAQMAERKAAHAAVELADQASLLDLMATCGRIERMIADLRDSRTPIRVEHHTAPETVPTSTLTGEQAEAVGQDAGNGLSGSEGSPGGAYAIPDRNAIAESSRTCVNCGRPIIEGQGWLSDPTRGASHIYPWTCAAMSLKTPITDMDPAGIAVNSPMTDTAATCLRCDDCDRPHPTTTFRRLAGHTLCQPCYDSDTK